jgi:putative hydrolases of HD superfamily
MDFDELLKTLTFYELKKVPRNSSNHYTDEKSGVTYERKETVSEHIHSSLKLADYFLAEPEFSDLDRLRVYEILLYHDDAEIVTGDIGIADKRDGKDEEELAAITALRGRVPARLEEKLVSRDAEYRAQATPEARFAKAVDKMDALLHEWQYPADWGPKNFDERLVRKLFQPAFMYSSTFTSYFEEMVSRLGAEGYFEKIQQK